MIFIDTWAWVALAIPEDQHHTQAAAIYRRLIQSREPMVTSDYVLGETITFLFGRTDGSTRNAVHRRCTEPYLAGWPYVGIGDPGLLPAGLGLRKRYQDKPDISFTDFTSVAIMEALQVVKIFSGDRHFSQVNVGFQLVSKVRPG